MLAVTLDNATNNDTFAKDLSRRLKEESDIDWDYESYRFRCFNHILNLAGQAALDRVKEDVDKVWKVIAKSSYCIWQLMSTMSIA